MPPYKTDEKLRSYLDTDQLRRERMCLAILATDRRFSSIQPRHPRGGRDNARDVELLLENGTPVYCAVGFHNQANDSNEQKRRIKQKFKDDLANALAAKEDLKAFIFCTNLNLTVGEKEGMMNDAFKRGMNFCEIWDRERMRIVLDSPTGFCIRFQYLKISLSVAEQASFFSCWGDDIQGIITAGLSKIDTVLGKILFYHESYNLPLRLRVVFNLSKEFSCSEIQHFRAFCMMRLLDPRDKVSDIIFGCSDKSNRFRENTPQDSADLPGIEHGISSCAWNVYVDDPSEKVFILDRNGTPEQISSGASVGCKAISSIGADYYIHDFSRQWNHLRLCDIDSALFLPFCNKSLSEKISSFSVFGNGYEIMTFSRADIEIDDGKHELLDTYFSSEELNDSWVVIRPKSATNFTLDMLKKSPIRKY